MILEPRGRESSGSLEEISKIQDGWVHSLIIPSEMSDNEREAFSRRERCRAPDELKSGMPFGRLDIMAKPPAEVRFPVTGVAGRE